MKKMFKWALFAALGFAVAATTTACGDDEPAQDSLSVAPNETLVFAADQNSAKQLTVTTNVTDWKAKPDASWCHVEKSGDKLDVSVDPYTSTAADRTTKITIIAGNAKPVEINVRQVKASNTIVSLRVSPHALTFGPNESGAKTLKVSCDGRWEVSTEATWCHITRADAEVKISVDPYTATNQHRSTLVVFTATGAKPVEIPVVQTPSLVGITLSATPLELTFEADQADGQAVSVITNAADWSFKSDHAWCQAEQSEDKKTLTVKATANPGEERVARITLTAGDAEPVTITVTQHAAQVDTSIQLKDIVGEYTGTMTFTTANENGGSTTSEPESIDVNIADGKLTLPSFPVRTLLETIVGKDGADVILPQVGILKYDMPIGTVTSDEQKLEAPLTTPQLILDGIDIGIGGPMTVAVELESVGPMEYTATGETVAFKLHTLTLALNEATSPFTQYTFNFTVSKKK